MMFEYVRQPKVSVLAQQVQTDDKEYRLRSWAPFSETFKSIDRFNSEDDRDLPENDTNHSSCLFWCNIADYLLSNLCYDSIEIIEDQKSKQLASDETYRSEIEDNMQYAKWFRPFTILTLFTSIFWLITLSQNSIKSMLERQRMEADEVLVTNLTIQTSRV